LSQTERLVIGFEIETRAGTWMAANDEELPGSCSFSHDRLEILAKQRSGRQNNSLFSFNPLEELLSSARGQWPLIGETSVPNVVSFFPSHPFVSREQCSSFPQLDAIRTGQN
jgi:hypothetical protein